jgi:hypothetical protein
VITNATFGTRFGKLGNQIFQVGMLFAVRERHGFDFSLTHDGEALWDCFDLDVVAEAPASGRRFEEEFGSCNYDPRVFEQPDGTSYLGYFQSYRYLEDCKPALTRFLRFNPSHRALSEATLFALRRRHQRPLVSLHVRRGDYLNADAEERWGNLARDGYYERAIAAIGHDVTYLVFSDDLEWCRRNFDLERVEFVDLDHGTSLCMMTGCDVNIVANSSFSWWGAYLNPAGEVYAPSRWWKAALAPNEVQDDIVPPRWHTVPTFA